MLFGQKSPALLVLVANGGDRQIDDKQADIATYTLNWIREQFSKNMLNGLSFSDQISINHTQMKYLQRRIFFIKYYKIYSINCFAYLIWSKKMFFLTGRFNYKKYLVHKFILVIAFLTLKKK